VFFLKFLKKRLQAANDCDCIEINRRLVLLGQEIERLERQITRQEERLAEEQKKS
jgi:uncharacterized small protein (DUF1192 family)